MRSTPLFQVDAFTNVRFRGNPAAVCPLNSSLSDDLLQQIAMENNVSETAFFAPDPEHDGDFRLRWFTPTVEVDLCGHATLASAFVLMTELEPGRTHVTFHTHSGALRVARDGDAFTLDFPALHVEVAPMPEGVVEALGACPEAWLASPACADQRESSTAPSRRAIAVFESANQVRSLRPSFARVAALPGIGGVAVTARATDADTDVDFVSRYFAPAKGIDEDPVTGSAHCALAPYWAQRLGKTSLRARQVSARGGELVCRVDGSRVFLTGRAVLTVRGELLLER